MNISPYQHKNNTFSTPYRIHNPSAKVITPKVPNSDAAVTNALLCEYRADVHMIPNCASTPQTMTDATHNIGLHATTFNNYQHQHLSSSSLSMLSVQTWLFKDICYSILIQHGNLRSVVRKLVINISYDLIALRPT